MDKQKFVREKLAQRYGQIKKKNSLFSARSFARLLDISVSTYSEFMSGKRLLSLELLYRLVDVDLLTQDEKEKFQNLPLKAGKSVFDAPELTEAIDFLQTRKDLTDVNYKNVCAIREDNDEKKKLVLCVDEKTMDMINKAIAAIVCRVSKIADSQDGNTPKAMMKIEIHSDFL